MEGLPLTRGWDDCSCKCHDSLFLSEQALQNAMIMDDTVPLGNFDHPNNNLCWKIIDSYIMVSPFPHFFSPESPAISPRFQAWTGGLPDKGTSSVPAQRQKHRGVQREDGGVEPNPWPHIKFCFWYWNPPKIMTLSVIVVWSSWLNVCIWAVPGVSDLGRDSCL